MAGVFGQCIWPVHLPVNIGHENLLNACCAPCFVQVSYFGSITSRSLAIAVDASAALSNPPAMIFEKDSVLKRPPS